MRILLRLNNTTKVIIMVTFTLIMFTTVFLLLGEQKVRADFNDYKDVPYDEHIYVALRTYERREPSGKDDTSTVREKGNWYIVSQVLEKGISLSDTSAGVVKNINLYMCIETIDGGLIYKETTPKDDTSKSSFNPDPVFGTESSGLTQQEEYDSKNKTYTPVNKSPKIIYVKVVYDVRVKKDDNTFQYERGLTLMYKIDVARAEDQNFESYKDTDLLSNGFVNFGENEFFGVYIQRRDNTDLTKRTYRVSLFYNPTEKVMIKEIRDTPIPNPTDGDKYISNSNNYVYTYNESTSTWSSAAAKQNVAYCVESTGEMYLYNPTTKDYAKVNNPNQVLFAEDVKKVDVNVYLKGKNDPKDSNEFLSNYIHVASLSGLIIETPQHALSGLPTNYLNRSTYRTSVEYSSAYEVEKIYIETKITLNNNQSIVKRVIVVVEDLAKF